MQIESHLSSIASYTKINLKYINNKQRCRNMKCAKERIRKNIQNIGFSQYFPFMIQH